MSSGVPTHSEFFEILNSRAAIEKIVKSLSDRATARPFPHLRVVGPSPFRTSKKRGIFTDFTQTPPHVVGFKVAFTPSSSVSPETRAITIFSFAVPRHARPDAPQAFENFKVRMETDPFGRRTVFMAESDIRGSLLNVAADAVVPTAHPEMQVYRLDEKASEHFSFPVPVKYRTKEGEEAESKVECELYLEKKIEQREGYFTVEVKIKNLSSSEGKVVDFLQQGETQFYEDAQEEDESGRFMRESDYILPGYLLEFDLCEQISNGHLSVSTDRPSPALRVFNVVPLCWDPTSIYFADYFIGEEKIFPMKSSGRSLDEFATSLQRKGLNLDSSICGALQEVFGKRSLQETFLWLFQEEAVENILNELKERKGYVTIVSVRTAGGKTEGFIIPLLQHCLEKSPTIGTKAIIFYPTKALANDQAKRLFRLLYFCNAILKSKGQRPITMALYHGDIETEMTGEVDWVPFKCVRGCEVHLTQARQNEKNFLQCPMCGQAYDYCFVTRGDAHFWLPDIVISNPDTLTYVMTWRAERHSILGRALKGCAKCGWTTTALGARKCQGRENCESSLVAITPQQVPDVFIYDEVHLFNGALGMNVSAFNRRLRSLLLTYAKRISSQSSFNPVWIGSSATIRDAAKFASVFFDVDPKRVQVVPPDPDTAVDRERMSHKRFNLFLLPRAYRAKQTTSLLVKYLLDLSREAAESFKPRVLGFVNSLRDCNDLILETKSRINTELFKIDGHNTQYDKEQRSDREMKFNKGELQVLFATSTLEVGIDFEDVHALLIFSPPFHFNDYLQRIGRAGRKTDALVITVCKSNQAIDYWYFEHASEIIERPNRWTHRIPIGEENPQVIQKAMKLAVFDCIYQRPDIADIIVRDKVTELLMDRTRGDWTPQAKEQLVSYLCNVFGTAHEKQSKEVIVSLSKSILGFQGDYGRSLIEAVHTKLNDDENLDNLRSSERSVTVQYIFGMPS